MSTGVPRLGDWFDEVTLRSEDVHPQHQTPEHPVAVLDLGQRLARFRTVSC